MAAGDCSPTSTAIRSCGSFGTCFEPTPGSALCRCSSGYTFDVTRLDAGCQPIKGCESIQGKVTEVCLNGGECENAGPPLYFRCKCKDNYSGSRCQEFDNPCSGATAVCLNGAICHFLPNAPNRFVCECPKGYQGDFCEKKLEYGLGGGGSALSGSAIVGLWTIVVVLIVILLYCLVMCIKDWWRNHCGLPFMRGKATKAAVSAKKAA